MGSAGSLNIQSNNCIYISYDYGERNNVYLRVLRDELIKMNFHIVYSETTSEALNHLSYQEITENIKNIMSRTVYFILCISKETLRSFHQAIEIENAFNGNKKMLYLLIDEMYTPLNTQCVKWIVSNNKWMPFYSKETVSDTLKYLNELLDPEP